MDGPQYRCDYLGFTAISKPPTGVNALQSHLKDLYIRYRRQGTGGRAATLKVIQNGIFITLLQDGKLVDQLFFSFDTVNFIEVVKFAAVRTASDRKPKAIFVPVEETKGPVSDKHAFHLDKSTQFLATVSHPPLVACVVRRPKGVKALDCHLFALESVENALHITSLVGFSQTPSGYDARNGTGNDPNGSAVELSSSKSDSNFNRGVRGDVIRPDISDYSFYRGQQPTYETVPNLSHSQPSSSYDIMGGSRLPPNNAQRKPPPGGVDPFGMAGHNIHGHSGTEEALVYGLYEQPRPGAQLAGPMQYQRRHDDSFDENVVMRKKDNSIRNTPGNRSVSTGSEHSFVTAGLRHQDELRISNRLSAPGVSQDSPRYHANNNDHQHNNYPQTQHSIPLHPVPQFNHNNNDSSKSPNQIASPKSSTQQNPDFGPVFSASNLENREREQINARAIRIDEQQQLQQQRQQQQPSQDHIAGGKPIAKVPPHLRGVKVLPTDFRNVKLKHAEKRSGSIDSNDSTNYDNDNDIMEKYKVLQQHEQTSSNSNGHHRSPLNGVDKNRNNNYTHENDSFNAPMRTDKNKNGKNGSLENSGRHPHRFSAPVYPGGGIWSHKGKGPASSGPAYNMGSEQFDAANTKDAEIANMFSKMELLGSRGRTQQNGMDFEQSLGYLP